MFGYTFKPVSFWYCHDEAGRLRAIVVEVNNTFGERHCYLLDAPRYGQTLQARKVFHVSPFCNVEGSYRFRVAAVAQGKNIVPTVSTLSEIRSISQDATGQMLVQVQGGQTVKMADIKRIGG
jgi:DUF1365 family protein